MKDIRQNWKELANSHQITSQDVAAFCIYKSIVAEQDKQGLIARLHKSFKAITNSKKLENGAMPLGCLQSALFLIKYSNFIKWLSPEESAEIMSLAKEVKVSGGNIE